MLGCIYKYKIYQLNNFNAVVINIIFFMLGTTVEYICKDIFTTEGLFVNLALFITFVPLV
jgi:hypothetical protein